MNAPKSRPQNDQKNSMEAGTASAMSTIWNKCCSESYNSYCWQNTYNM